MLHGLIYQARPQAIPPLGLMNRPDDSQTGLMNQTPTIEFVLRRMTLITAGKRNDY
jgi:hypothetical protein